MIKIETEKKGRYWIARSRQFKTFGSSKYSESAAIKDLKRALTLFFKIHVERDTIANLIVINH